MPTNNSKKRIYKLEKLNQGSFGSFSNMDYQVFLLLISRIRSVDSSGEYLYPHQLQREHILKASELCSVFSVDKSNSYRVLKKSCDKLLNKTLILEKPELNEVWKIGVCSMAKYNEKNGTITIKFTDDIMPYLAQVKERFTLYSLKEVSKFSSLYTTRLYELLQDFKTTGWMVKSIEQLRLSFAVGNKFSRYNGFKERTFSPACEEINRHHNLNLRFEEIKEGRSVIAIKFTFNKLDYVESIDPNTERKKRHYKKTKNLLDVPPKKTKVKQRKNSTKNNSHNPKEIQEKNTKEKGGFFTSLFEKFKRRKAQ
jgi:plasmid replication initiation protein